MSIHDLVRIRIRQIRTLAHPSRLSDEVLAEHPEPRAFKRSDNRPHKSLIIETCSKHRPEQLIDGSNIRADIGPSILPPCLETVERLDPCCRRVGFATTILAKTNQSVGFL